MKRKIKLLVTESQMRFLLENTKIEGLKKVFNVVKKDEWEGLSKKNLSKIKITNPEDKDKDIKLKALKGDNNELLALYTVETSQVLNKITGEMEERRKYKIRPSEESLEKVVEADPTPNKIYSQWMMNSFIKLIKSGEEHEAVRFIEEDLSQANEYLTVFSQSLNDERFKSVTANISGLPEDPANINQYRDLAQLFRAVEAFIDRPDSNIIKKEMKKFVLSGQAKILYEDSKWIVYNPLTREANCAISIGEWCTARAENSYFKSYTTNNPEPNGSPSKIYVIINKDVLEGNSDEVYQFHFETDQFRNRTQTDERGISGRNFNWNDFLDANPGLRKFFVDRVTPLAKERGGDIMNNKYLKYLLAMGEVMDIFEFFDENIEEIDLQTLKMKKLPDSIGKFKNLTTLTINDLGLEELPESIGQLSNLQFLMAKGNNFKKLPTSIGKLKNLQILLLSENSTKIKIPKSISGLDPDKGGSLFKLIVKDSVSPDTLKSLKELLPGLDNIV